MSLSVKNEINRRDTSTDTAHSPDQIEETPAIRVDVVKKDRKRTPKKSKRDTSNRLKRSEVTSTDVGEDLVTEVHSSPVFDDGILVGDDTESPSASVPVQNLHLPSLLLADPEGGGEWSIVQSKSTRKSHDCDMPSRGPTNFTLSNETCQKKPVFNSPLVVTSILCHIADLYANSHKEQQQQPACFQT